MTKLSLVGHENMFLTLITCVIFDVAICQLPTYSGSLVIKNIGVKLCQLKCIENGFCQSIEYTISTLTCHLSEKDHDTITNEVQYVVGSKDLEEVRAGSCQLKTCQNMRCLETRTGKTECVEEIRNQTQVFTKCNTTLLDACMDGDLARVKDILSDGQANINSMGKDNMTPVMHAAKEGHKTIFDLLVREGANLSLVDDEDKNILHLACIGGSVEIVKYVLIQNTVGINSRDLHWVTPAMNAALYNRKGVLDLLVEEGADMSLVNEVQKTILHLACEGGDVDIIKYLLDTVDINSQDVNGYTSVMLAANRGQKDVFDVLVEAGSDLSLVSDNKETVFHLACAGGNVDIVKFLFSHAIVDVNSRDSDGWTSVMHAITAGNKDVYNFLVEKGANLSEVYAEKRTLLHEACEVGNIEIIRSLLKHDIVDIDSRDMNGWTPIMHATNDGHKDAFDVLVEAGADLLLVTNDKETILHMACGGGNVEIVKYLLKHDLVDIDSRDKDGWTPVMRASEFRHKNVFDVLVEKGADLLLVNTNKETVLHVACDVGNVETTKYLLKYEVVDIDSRDIAGWTPVMRAASFGHKDVFDVLVEAGADLSQVNDGDQTIVHLSCEGDHVEILKYLLNNTIMDINNRDQKGMTPVMLTALHNSKDVFDLLVKWGADLSLHDEENHNILHLACLEDSADIARYLLLHKIVDINSRDQDDYTSAMIAARQGSETVFFLLVENEADLTLTNDVGDNILNLACDGGNEDIVKYVSTQHIVKGAYREDDPC